MLRFFPPPSPHRQALTPIDRAKAKKDASEIIFWRNGYEPLASLDDDGNGLLEGDELRHLSLWRDLNQNGISDPGEVQPLTSFGIVALETHSECRSAESLINKKGAHLANGTFLPTIDWIAQQAARRTRPNTCCPSGARFGL